MVIKNKDRLYVQFQHRHSLPNFHWTLVLVPATETNQSPCRAFDITNCAIMEKNLDGIMVDTNPECRWVYRRAREMYPFQDGSVVSRVLITKLPQGSLERLGDIMGEVPIDNNAPRDVFNCRIWTLAAIAHLRASGSFPDIPEPTTEFEDLAMAHAHASKAHVLANGLRVRCFLRAYRG